MSEEAVNKGRHVCAASNGHRSDVSTIFVNNRQDVRHLLLSLSLSSRIFFALDNTTTHTISCFGKCVKMQRCAAKLPDR